MGLPRSWGFRARVLPMALLAPEIIQSIVAASTDQALVLEQLERPLAALRSVRVSEKGLAERQRFS